MILFTYLETKSYKKTNRKCPQTGVTQTCPIGVTHSYPTGVTHTGFDATSVYKLTKKKAVPKRPPTSLPHTTKAHPRQPCGCKRCAPVLVCPNGLLHQHLLGLSSFVLSVCWFRLPSLPFHQPSTAPQTCKSFT